VRERDCVLTDEKLQAMDEIIGRFDDLELQHGYESGDQFQEECQGQEEEQALHEERERGTAVLKGKEPVNFFESREADEQEEEEGKEAVNSEPGEMTCAICLGEIPLEDLAMIKGCDHIYCSYCILQWTLHKEKCFCPQCKHEFSHLMTYRALDGTLNDFPVEESIVLLRRARWFEDSLKDNAASINLLEDVRIADENAWMDDYDDDEFGEDEEMEAFYFSSAAGKARIVIGNRRFGQGGYISGGHRQARPVYPKKSDGEGSSSGSKKKIKGKGKGKAPIDAMPVVSKSSAIKIRTPNANGGKPTNLGSSLKDCSLSDTQASPSPLLGSSPNGFGRRARRNAKRAAMQQEHSPSLSEMPASWTTEAH